jgi:hypothetical protein
MNMFRLLMRQLTYSIGGRLIDLDIPLRASPLFTYNFENFTTEKGAITSHKHPRKINLDIFVPC